MKSFFFVALEFKALFTQLYLDLPSRLVDPLDPCLVLHEVAHVRQERPGQEVHAAVDEVQALLEQALVDHELNEA